MILFRYLHVHNTDLRSRGFPRQSIETFCWSPLLSKNWNMSAFWKMYIGEAIDWIMYALAGRLCLFAHGDSSLYGKTIL